jgi:hypothetical protein
MIWCQLLLLAALGDLPQVEVDTLAGDHQTGQVVQLTPTTLKLKTADSEAALPVAQILEIRFPAAASVKPAAEPEPQVALVDGSRLGCTSLTGAGRELRLESARLGTVALPLASVAHIRFGAPDPKLDETWSGLLEKDSKNDLLVVRKGDVLDFLSGVIGDFDQQTVKFLLDKDEIPVKRDKVYGLIYKRPRATAKAACQIEIDGGDVLQLKQLVCENGEWKGALAAGPAVTLPADKLRSVDFSLGKLRYLSQMEPREVRYVPYFDVVWKYRRDQNLDGGPIRLGNKTYARGLAIHSQTFLRYRLAGDYRRFQAVMGIDQIVEGKEGDVHVVISGDGKELLAADVKGKDAPRVLDLDVTGVRDLDILVDFGGGLDIADHLDLADAKVTK